MVVSREGWYNILLHFTKSTAEKGIVWNGQLSLVSRLWVDNPDVCFLTKIPWIKVFCSQIPNSNVVEGDQNCCPCSRINLDGWQGETNSCVLKTSRAAVTSRLHERHVKIISKGMFGFQLQRTFEYVCPKETI